MRRLGVLERDAAEVGGTDEAPGERELPRLPQGLELRKPHLWSEARRKGDGRGLGGSADLGPVDRVGGDELVDVGVGPLGEGLGAAVDLLEVVEEGEVARPVLLHALEVLADPHRRRRRFAGHLDSFRRRGGDVVLLPLLRCGWSGGRREDEGRRH